MLVIPLKRLIEVSSTSINNYLDDAIKTFRCKQNRDVQNYLLNTARTHEKRSIARTYLIISKPKPEQKRIQILGYFTLSLKTLFCSQLSNSRKKKIHGMSKSQDYAPAFLIGQFARNDSTDKNTLSGNRIMEYAISYIKEAHTLIGGRVIILECEKKEKLMQFYRELDFSFLQEHSNREGLVQMIYYIKETSPQD